MNMKKNAEISKSSIEAAFNAAKVIRRSGVIIYPTETLYGLGCSALDHNAVEQIYKIKQRMLNKPLLVLVKDEEMLMKFFHISDNFLNIYSKLEDKPVSIILEQKVKFPGQVSANSGKIGVRISSNSFVKMLFNYLDEPITSTSANISGTENVYEFEEVKSNFQDKVDLIIDSGNLPHSNGSTIVDLTEIPPRLIREGDVPREEIKEFF